MKTIFIGCMAALVVSGCAGIAAPFIHNPFAGDYSGTFLASDGKAGPASVSLTNIGNVFGNLTDTKSGQAGTFNGSVDTHLFFTGSVVFPGASHSVSGTFAKSNNTISGTLTGPNSYSFTLTVDSKP
jgi:hypothetical protein